MITIIIVVSCDGRGCHHQFEETIDLVDVSVLIMNTQISICFLYFRAVLKEVYEDDDYPYNFT